MTDAHTHQPLPQGIVGVLNVKLSEANADAIPQGLYSVGIHPWEAHLPINWQLFSHLAQNAIAIGECGIDKNSIAPLQQQIEIFEQQIDIATQLGKPIIVHCVRAYGYLLNIIKKHSKQKWLIHGCYASAEWIKTASKYNVSFSIGPKQIHLPHIADVLNTIPPHKLMLETDDSGISISSLFRQISADEVVIDNNFKTFFSL